MNELTMLKAVLLGAIQGATEFLPVSSSGHLVIAQDLLGVRIENGGLLAFDVCLHFGTLVAVVAYFWRDFWAMAASLFRGGAGGDPSAGMDVRGSRRLLLMLLVGTVPAAIAGPILNDLFERLVSNAASAAAMLLVTGFILWGTRYARDRGIVAGGMKAWQAVAIGVAQAVAIVPGISRSGSTIAGGLYLGVEKGFAARFAFLLSVPAIAGATVFKLRDLSGFTADMIAATAVGTAVAAVVGFACIRWLMGVVRRGRLSWFAPYCWAVGMATLIYIFKFQ
jgi:undecaprenyl-diphosphatase